MTRNGVGLTSNCFARIPGGILINTATQAPGARPVSIFGPGAPMARTAVREKARTLAIGNHEAGLSPSGRKARFFAGRADGGPRFDRDSDGGHRARDEGKL